MTSAARWRPARVLASAITVLVLADGCSNSEDPPRPEGSNNPKPTPSSSRSPTDPSTSPPPTSPTPTAPEDPVRAEVEIRQAWQKLFDPGTQLDEKVGLIENGEQNELMVRPLFTDKRSKKLRATVTSVTFQNPKNAEVAYRLTLDGQPLQDGSPGASVLQDKTWKISLDTVCTLTKHGNDVPQAATCHQAE